MSETAIFDMTIALKRRIEGALENGKVRVGPPEQTAVGDSAVGLFLFQVEANRDLRNSPRMKPPEFATPFDAPATEENAIPLDLRYLVTVFRNAGPGGDPEELTRLGQVIRVLHAAPTFSDAELHGQTVRVTLEPASIDELNRIWSVLPEESYRTSLVYLATPVWIDAGPLTAGPPVLEREQHQGVLEPAGAAV